MPRITRLKRTRRRRGWTDVHLDGAFFCRLPGGSVQERGLREGVELEPKALLRIRDEAHRQAATERALRYLATRPRSRFELERHLRRRGYVDGAVGAAVARCRELGYVDDREFAAAFARDRIRLRPRSVARMEAELRRRGVSARDARAGVERALRDEEVDEEELLRRATQKALRRLGRRPREELERRLFGYLGRRGFRGADVRSAVRRALDRSGGGGDRDAPPAPGPSPRD